MPYKAENWHALLHEQCYSTDRISDICPSAFNIKNEWKNIFSNIMLNKKDFHKSKESINLLPVNADQIVVSDKFKHNDEGFKYFIGYIKGETVKPLCIILPQMSGYVKYFENGDKNMSFFIKDDKV